MVRCVTTGTAFVVPVIRKRRGCYLVVCFEFHKVLHIMRVHSFM